MTAQQALRQAQAELEAAGVTDTRAAWMLLEHTLGCKAAALLARLSQELPPTTKSVYDALAARVASGEPLQYVLGSWDFYGRPFRCDRRALIPRADTETLAAAAIEALRDKGLSRYIKSPADAGDARPFGSADNAQAHCLRALDVGCGTGCIGITLKLECPAAEVTLCDVSADALALSSENAASLRADVTLVQADLRDGLPGGPWDVIVSNPPYINAADMAALPVQVSRHEPHLALYGGTDGLDLVRALAAHAPQALRPGGEIFIEIGYDQSAAAQAILHKALGNARALKDLCGLERVVCATREV